VIDQKQIPQPVCYAIRNYILTYGYNSDPSELAAMALAAWPGARKMVDLDTGDDRAIRLPLTEARDGV